MARIVPDLPFCRERPTAAAVLHKIRQYSVNPNVIPEVTAQQAGSVHESRTAVTRFAGRGCRCNFNCIQQLQYPGQQCEVLRLVLASFGGRRKFRRNSCRPEGLQILAHLVGKEQKVCL